MEYQDNDFKYYMQDTGRLYFGARYSYAELMEHEMVPFKFKSIIEHYIMKDTEPDTTLESQFYYMTPEMFSCKTYMQLKTKVKVCLLTEKKSFQNGLSESGFHAGGICENESCAEEKARRQDSGNYVIQTGDDVIQRVVFPVCL